MTTHDPALQWAAERAGLPYDRFVAGLTPATIARIHAAYLSRYVYAQELSTVPLPKADAEGSAKEQIRAAFQSMKHTLPREIRPEAYQDLLEQIGVTTRPERMILEEVVKEEALKAQLSVNRRKLNHFLWWLGGQ